MGGDEWGEARTATTAYALRASAGGGSTGGGVSVGDGLLRKCGGDAAWAGLLAPFWDDAADVVVLEREEVLDQLLQARHALLLSSAARTAETGPVVARPPVEFPIEFVDVGRFSGAYDAEARRTLELGSDATRSAFDLDNYERSAAHNWDAFYRRNTDKFYKDRHYLLKDFAGLRQRLEGAPTTDAVRVLEIGCGVGNAMLPLVQRFEQCDASGVDFADKAIEILNETATERGLAQRCRGWVHDITADEPGDPGGFLATQVPTRVDFCTMVFVLSAVAPERMHRAAANVAGRLKPGGLLLFRDYAELDQAQLRFAKDQRLGPGHFVRQDGTRSFFFSLEGLAWLFERQCGLERVEARYIKRVVFNRSKGLRMRRVFAHCVYRRKE